MKQESLGFGRQSKSLNHICHALMQGPVEVEHPPPELQRDAVAGFVYAVGGYKAVGRIWKVNRLWRCTCMQHKSCSLMVTSNTLQEVVLVVVDCCCCLMFVCELLFVCVWS